MNHHKNEHISHTLSLGLSAGIISILARWITGTPILLYPKSFIKYGVIGGIGFFIMFGFAIFIFGYVGDYIRKIYIKTGSFYAFAQYKLNKFEANLFTFIIIALNIMSVFIQMIAIVLLLNILHIPFTVAILLFLILCFLVISFTKMATLNIIERFAIIIIFLGVIIVPIYLLAKDGVFPVYHGVRLYHPYLLFAKNNDTYLFIFIGLLISFGKVLSDLATWQRLYAFSVYNIKKIFSFASFILISVPITLSLILLITIHHQALNDSNAIFFDLYEKIQLPFIALLFFLFCLTIMTTTIVAELYAISNTCINLLQNMHKLTFKRYKTIFIFINGVLLLSLTSLAIQFANKINILSSIILMGHLYVSLIPVILTLIFSNRRSFNILIYIPILNITFILLFSLDALSLESIIRTLAFSTIAALSTTFLKANDKAL